MTFGVMKFKMLLKGPVVGGVGPRRRATGAGITDGWRCVLDECQRSDLYVPDKFGG